MVLNTSPLRRLLVVCYGNIYRSPYAAELLRMQLKGVSEVHSSGFHPVAGRPSPPTLVAVSSTLGVNLAGHRSTVVTLADLAWADAIVVMDRHNWQAVHNLMADSKKIIWLGALDGGGDIPDPFGLPESQVRDSMHRVDQCTKCLAAEILARCKSSTN